MDRRAYRGGILHAEARFPDGKMVRAKSATCHRRSHKQRYNAMEELTCILRRKPAWLNELKLSAAVMNMDAITGVLA